MMKIFKQKHGHINPIFSQEERNLLSSIEKAKYSTTNSQILGINGEKWFINFLNKYLPICFRAVTGHFITPTGELSPQIDVIVMDSRYPVLCNNEGGSVVCMLHSVIATIEVKLTLNKKEINKILQNDEILTKLNSSIFPVRSDWGRGNIIQIALAYSSSIKLNTIKKHYFNNPLSSILHTPLYLLRLHESEQLSNEGDLGAIISLEGGKLNLIMTTLAPLSDLFYILIQNSYFTLASRGFGNDDLGNQMTNYMNWGTYPCLNRGLL
jgi:hypothetical protein